MTQRSQVNEQLREAAAAGDEQAARLLRAAAETSDPVIQMLSRAYVNGVPVPGGIETALSAREHQINAHTQLPAEEAKAIDHARRHLLADLQVLEHAAHNGSQAAVDCLVRAHSVMGRYEAATAVLAAAAQTGYAEAPALVTVAPDALGPDLPLDGDGHAEMGGDVYFTVISPDPAGAAAAFARARARLGDVDERGVVMSDEERDEAGIAWDEYYTPNWVSDVECCDVGARLRVDTKGVMWAAMGRSMLQLLSDALIQDRIPGHLVDGNADLSSRFSHQARRD